MMKRGRPAKHPSDSRRYRLELGVGEKAKEAYTFLDKCQDCYIQQVRPSQKRSGFSPRVRKLMHGYIYEASRSTGTSFLLTQRHFTCTVQGLNYFKTTWHI